MSLSSLPILNACLNATSLVLLLFGWRFIKQGRKEAHRNCMIAALIVSTLFLVSYVTYHMGMQRVHGAAHTKFLNPEWFRPIYLVILVTHLIAAIAIVPMVLVTLTRALREKFDAHKRIARWTWPLWVYVSATGVLIYFLLYQIFPQR